MSKIMDFLKKIKTSVSSNLVVTASKEVDLAVARDLNSQDPKDIEELIEKNKRSGTKPINNPDIE